MKKVVGHSVIVAAILAFQAACGSVDQSQSDGGLNETSNASPNVLIIVADDLGFSDLGAFGGEIETPNLDALANAGVRLTSFYAAPNCSPTRSMLLTGQDNHTVGLGVMAEALPSFPMLQGRPGYEGYLNPQTTTIAEKFYEADYRTMVAGKWHLGKKPEHQPSEHGFDRSFVMLGGGGDHFGYGQNGEPALEPLEYTEDGVPATYPTGTYSSDFYADQMIAYLSEDAQTNRPFFAYLAFTAPHWPLQAPKDLIAKYEGHYDSGPMALRRARLARMSELGLLDGAGANVNLSQVDEWENLSPEQRAISSRYMEIYAAMVDSLDHNVGKVIKYLKQTGQYENTVIIFISDNGAEGIHLDELIGRSSSGTLPQHKAEVMATAAKSNVDLALMGTKDSFITYGPAWAQAASAPFRKYKAETEEGGIRTPAFILGPGVQGQRIIDAPLSVRDIMPTVLEIADIGYDQDLVTPARSVDGVNAPVAKSWLPILTGDATTVRTENDPIARELFLKRAVRLGNWKAVYGKADDADPADRGAPSSWRLYNLSEDPSERNDVIDEYPEEFARLKTAWDLYAEENGVFVPGPISE